MLALSLMALLAATAPSPEAVAAFQSGEKALEAGQLEVAAGQYLRALKVAPGFAAALNGLGSVQFRQGKRAEAIGTFQAAIVADPKLKLAYFNLGFAARKAGDFPLARRAYQSYLALDPSDAEGYYGLGEAERSLGQREDALRAYQTYVSLEKRPSEQRWVDRAKDYILQLQAQPSPQGSNAVGTAAAAPPAGALGATAPERVAEGDRALRAGNAAAAVVAYQSALQLDPSNVEALFKQGNALEKTGDYRAAIEKWERVIQLSPEAAVRKSAQQNVDKTRARLAQATSPAPAAGTPQARAREAYQRGVQLVMARDYAAAVVALNEALAADAALAVAYTARGSANVGLRRFYEAAADYEDALRLDPSRASPLYGLAEAYRGLGRAADAAIYYERYAHSTAADAQANLQADARSKAAALTEEASGADAGMATPLH